MEREDLLKILEGNVSHIDSVNIDDIASYETRVTIEPHHVRKMLLDYLAGKICAEDLTRWAIFLCIRSEYGSANYMDDEMVNFEEDMFHVVQCLSTPEIDGEINEKQAKLYLGQLDKYFK